MYYILYIISYIHFHSQVWILSDFLNVLKMSLLLTQAAFIWSKYSKMNIVKHIIID